MVTRKKINTKQIQEFLLALIITSIHKQIYHVNQREEMRKVYMKRIRHSSLIHNDKCCYANAKKCKQSNVPCNDQVFVLPYNGLILNCRQFRDKYYQFKISSWNSLKGSNVAKIILSKINFISNF